MEDCPVCWWVWRPRAPVIAARIGGIAPTRGRGGAITAGRRSRRPRRGHGRSSSSGRLEGSMRRCGGWRCAASLGISESSVSCSGWSKRRSRCCRMRSGVWSALRGLAPRSFRGWRRRCGAVDHGGRPAFARSLPRTRSFAAGSKMARSITVGGEGKPVRIRRGPATVTGDAHRGAPMRRTATGPPSAGREGAEE